MCIYKAYVISPCERSSSTNIKVPKLKPTILHLYSTMKMMPRYPYPPTTSNSGRLPFYATFVLLSLSSTLVQGVMQPLRTYHPECTSVTQSRTPQCMAAMHRACYLNGIGDVAYPQEVGRDEISFLCMHSISYADVAYSEIPNCAGQSSQTSSCYNSARRYCERFNSDVAGIIQELGDGVAGLACVPTPWSKAVPQDELAALHPGCNHYGKSQAPECASASHGYCNSQGFVGGFIDRVENNQVTVACVSDATLTSANIR